MAEEHGFQAPEGHRLCANNCGFFGSPATRNLCSKCYRDVVMNEEQANSAKSAVESCLSASSSAPAAFVPLSVDVPSQDADEERRLPAEPVAQANRCSVCRRRVGLGGFRCRCGTTFCGTHRYPEQHGCSFDFKAVGREAIAMANPVVKAEKLRRI